MRIILSAALFLGIDVLAMPLRAEEPGELIEEIWESAQIEGAHIGSLHTTVRKLDAGKRLRTTAELELSFRRHRALLRLRRQQGTDETPQGKVVGVFMSQGQDGGRQFALSGVVEEDKMHIRADNGRLDRRIRWSEEVIGLYRLEHLFRERKPKEGDRFAFLRYEPTYNTVLTVRVLVKEREPVGRSHLLRVEMTPDQLESAGVRVQPPPVVWWLDEKFVPVRRQFELEGLGKIVLIRTSRKEAAAPPTPRRLTDIGLKTLLPLNRVLVRPYASQSVVYRIHLRGDSDPGSALARDGHQEIRNLKGETFELHVHPVQRGKSEIRNPKSEIGQEYLASCRFIDSADARIQELARKAVGDTKDPWEKARRIERWVKRAMQPDHTVAMGPASETARQLRGDCRQYALLTAAMCRAEGVPARTVVGLLYIEKSGRPYLGFHMWIEVGIEGQWLGLDATLGRGGVSAAHVKIADHSWYKTASLTPLLPVNRVLGRMEVAVLRVAPRP